MIAENLPHKLKQKSLYYKFITLFLFYKGVKQPVCGFIFFEMCIRDRHNGLQLQPEDRIRTVDDRREQLSGSPSTMATNKIKYETPIEDAPKKQDQPTTTADEDTNSFSSNPA